MPYAYVVAGSVQTTGNPPQTWKLKDGRWCSGFDLRSDLWQAEGWLPLTENRPAVTAQQTYGEPTFTVTATAVTADYPVVSQPPLVLAQQSQDTATAQLLARAAALLTNYAAARATMATAVGALPANPTAAQLATFIKGPLATYLVADNDTEVAVIKGLANFIARQSGSPATF